MQKSQEFAGKGLSYNICHCEDPIATLVKGQAPPLSHPQPAPGDGKEEPSQVGNSRGKHEAPDSLNNSKEYLPLGSQAPAKYMKWIYKSKGLTEASAAHLTEEFESMQKGTRHRKGKIS